MKRHIKFALIYAILAMVFGVFYALSQSVLPKLMILLEIPHLDSKFRKKIIGIHSKYTTIFLNLR